MIIVSNPCKQNNPLELSQADGSFCMQRQEEEGSGGMLTRICQRCGKKVVQGQRCDCYVRPGRRDEKDHAFYSSAMWKKIAKAARQRAQYLDEYELAYRGRLTAGTIVHHIFTVKERPDMMLSLDNLIVVSRKTHDMIHDAYAKGDREARLMRDKLLAIRRGGRG